ncbi:MAG: aspartate/glutamate racemase family protein [Hungatella sp.]
MKAALVYTSTTPELMEWVETEVRKQLGGEVELLSYQNGEILAKTREAGYVTAEAAAELAKLFMTAIQDGADAILNICSSVGEAADAMQDFADYSGVPIVRIDQEMCREAVRLGSRIAIMATLPTTLQPTKNTVMRMARSMGRVVTPVEVLVDGAFGLNPEEFRMRMLEKAGEVAAQVDVILLCQGSMAYCEQLLADTYHKPVLSSPRFGAAALKKALQDKGLLK